MKMAVAKPQPTPVLPIAFDILNKAATSYEVAALFLQMESIKFPGLNDYTPKGHRRLLPMS